MDAEAAGPLLTCKHCQRKFRPEAHARHVKICVKVFKEGRKEFNTMEHRMPAEAVKLAKESRRAQAKASRSRPGGNAASADNRPINAKQMPSWRMKSEAFRQAIKESRVVTKYQREGRLAELPPAKATPVELDDRIPCPHCGRRFAAEPAARHIPKCKDIKARAKRPPRGR